MERSDHQSLPKNQENSSSLLSHKEPNNNNTLLTDHHSPARISVVDRLKRDEWSEGAVASLLEAYEAKWVLRNRAKLKGQDWEDVARHVSGRSNSSKSAKTQTQCKNKIESMKKRYRSESSAAAADGSSSSWPLYSRLDLLLRGNGGPAAGGVAPAPGSGGQSTAPASVVVVELPAVVAAAPPQVAAPPPTAAVLEQGSVAQNSQGSNGGGDRLAKERDAPSNGARVTNHAAEKNPVVDDDTESSTPAIYSTGKEKLSNVKSPYNLKSKKPKRAREEYYTIGESIRWVAEVVVRSEQARMETMREIERMRAEVEAKRSEIDLRRTEIIANTQLQIAKLFAKGSLD